MPTLFETYSRNLILFQSDSRLLDSDVVFLVWNAGHPNGMKVNNPKKWVTNGQTWYVSPGHSKNYIYLYKNTKTRFVLAEEHPYILSPTGSLLLGNHISFGISRLRDKDAVALKTHYVAYKKEQYSDLWDRLESRCDITMKSNKVLNTITSKYENGKEIFAKKYRKVQLDVIHQMIEIVQNGVESGSASGGAPSSVLYNQDNWKILNDKIILDPLIFTSDLAQVMFIDENRDQITCHCDYISGHRRIFAVDKSILKMI